MSSQNDQAEDLWWAWYRHCGLMREKAGHNCACVPGSPSKLCKEGQTLHRVYVRQRKIAQVETALATAEES